MLYIYVITYNIYIYIFVRVIMLNWDRSAPHLLSQDARKGNMHQSTISPDSGFRQHHVPGRSFQRG